MDEKLIKTHQAVWQVFDLMTESHERRVNLRTRLVQEYSDQFLSTGKAPDINLSFADSQEAAFLETEVFEAVVDELASRHRAALAQAAAADFKRIQAAREAKQAERLLATEQKQEMRIDGDIQELSAKLQDCHPIREFFATPEGLYEAARSNPYIGVNPLHLARLLHGRADSVGVRIIIESDGKCRFWDGSAYRM